MVATDVAVEKIERRQLDLKDYKLPGGHFRGAVPEDCSRVINKSTVIVDAATGRPSIVYLKLPESPEATKIAAALQRIKYDTTTRTNGMTTRSKVFGFSPRIAIRRDYCNAASLARDEPTTHRLLEEYAHTVATLYQEWHPELFAEHQQLTEKVLPEWRLKESPFTSGIINQNNILPYHHDAGNFKNVWSNMLVFKKDVSGGLLAVPEYDIALEVADNTLTMFDGQNLLHGVTPMRRLSPRSYRYSVVYYSLQGMWQCKTAPEEVQRIQELRTERERKRARPQKKDV